MLLIGRPIFIITIVYVLPVYILCDVVIISTHVLKCLPKYLKANFNCKTV